MKTTSFKQILFPTDLTPHSLSAFAYAADVAEWHDATLHVLYVIHDRAFYLPEDLGIFDTLPVDEDALKTLFWEKLPSLLRTDKKFKLSIETGHSVADTIVEFGETHAIDLVIMGTQGHRRLLHPTGLGGTAGSVLRRTAAPVLTWHPSKDIDVSEWTPPKHVLATVDFSDQSRKVLRAAKDWAVHYNAALSVVFVAEERIVPVFNDTLIPGIFVMKPDADQLKHAGESLSKLYHSVAGPKVTATYHIRHGNPAQEILTFIKEEKVDLVMISSHGQTAGQQFSLGSTSEKIARKARCAVFTLKAS